MNPKITWWFLSAINFLVFLYSRCILCIVNIHPVSNVYDLAIWRAFAPVPRWFNPMRRAPDEKSSDARHLVSLINHVITLATLVILYCWNHY